MVDRTHFPNPEQRIVPPYPLGRVFQCLQADSARTTVLCSYIPSPVWLFVAANQSLSVITRIFPHRLHMTMADPDANFLTLRSGNHMGGKTGNAHSDKRATAMVQRKFPRLTPRLLWTLLCVGRRQSARLAALQATELRTDLLP
jgi:hypothetical protein